MTTRVPKRVDVNLLRARLGDKEAERLLMKLYAPPLMPTIKIPPEQYQNTLELLEGSRKGKGKVQLLPLVMRQWFYERPRNAGVFKGWLKEQIALTAPPVVEAPTVVRRAKKRRKAA